MAEQGWNFAVLDDEYNNGGPFAVHDVNWTPDDLNGGPWNDYAHMNANDVGDHWSSDTWNEPFPDHTADAPSSAQRPPDHTLHALVPLSSPPPQQHVNNEPQRFDPLADAHATNNHNALHHQPREPHPVDPTYRRPSRDLPRSHLYQPARFVPPTLFHQTVPEQETHIHTPPRQSHDTQYQAIETDSDDDATMPTRRRPAAAAAAAAAGSPVDLTQSPAMATASASQQSRTRKRSSTSNAGDSGSVRKRTKRTSMSTARVDVTDLEEDEAPSADAELLQAQQRDALAMQESTKNKDEGAVKIGQRTCIICLENYTNATTAICGHIFCHECLTRALMASEKNNDRGKGNCPACRKAINRKSAKEVIPISFLKKSAFRTKGRQAHNR